MTLLHLAIMTLLGKGNVGIITNSPTANLEINSGVVSGVPTLYLNRLADQTNTSDIALRGMLLSEVKTQLKVLLIPMEFLLGT